MDNHLFALLKKFDQLHLAKQLEMNPACHTEVLECFLELDGFTPLSFEKKHTRANLLSFNNPSNYQNQSSHIVPLHLKQKKIASVILAGGDGSRLGSSLPKGCFPFSLDQNRTLFEIHCSKLVSLKNKLQTSIPLIILTSKNNHLFTQKFFLENNFFGLEPSSVEFLVQPHLPFFKNQQAFFKNAQHFASGPNGNGVIFKLLKDVIENHPTIETFQVINIDNPLAYPIDLELLETHLINENQLTLRCIPLSKTHQNIGRLYKTPGNKILIVDYTDDAQNPGANFGSINIFAFSKNFILSICKENYLPLHWVQKNTKTLDCSNLKDQQTYLKGELFITDASAFSEKTSCLLTDPEKYFAPLKSLEGPGNLYQAQQAYKKKQESLCPTGCCFDPNLYYSSVDLQKIDASHVV